MRDFAAFSLSDATGRGEKDNLVPLEQTQTAIAAHGKCGGTNKLTVYPGVGHNAWERAYDGRDLYEWLFEQ